MYKLSQSCIELMRPTHQFKFEGSNIDDVLHSEVVVFSC